MLHSKVLTSWRMEFRLERVEELVSRMRGLSFIHVRHDGNKVADSLANVSMEVLQVFVYYAWDGLSNETLGVVCKLQVFNDIAS